GTLAFVLSTHGFISGKTLRAMESAVTSRGFRVVAGHALHTPESYPPMIVRGKGNEQAPNPKEQSAFDTFISELSRRLRGAQAERGTAGKRIRIGLLGSLMPSRPRTTARKDMGEKHVDEPLCTECGICEKGCPYGAIRLDPRPVFDTDECYGCWSCYNHCPEKAIYTKKFRGVGHYPRPIDLLREKLRV
ncbi:MAG: EFR1 family ferrodoxin, partial [Candidatus Eisenbacteria sp.]|nr:EFR1 family ferrodoxin [Candidatus Eisenbacteria bacterium]